MERFCKYCSEPLTNTNYFCDEVCEQKYRDETKELYILYKEDESYDWFCPIVKFEETNNELIFSNDSSDYRLDKEEIKRWKIDKCSCLGEFTETNCFIL